LENRISITGITVRHTGDSCQAVSNGIAAGLQVKRTLRKCNYPPDKLKKATDTVIKQAELLGEQYET